MADERNIPVCNLFSKDSNQESDSSTGLFMEKPSATTKDVNDEKALCKDDLNVKPCNLFGSPSDSDVFAEISSPDVDDIALPADQEAEPSFGDSTNHAENLEHLEMHYDQKNNISSQERKAFLVQECKETIDTTGGPQLVMKEEIKLEDISNKKEDTMEQSKVLPFEQQQSHFSIQQEKPTNNQPTLASALFTTMPSQNSLFDSLEHQFSNDETDAFSYALSNGEVERREQAWIPSEKTQAVLDSKANFKPTELQFRLTKPQVSVLESLGNPTIVQLQVHGILADVPKLSAKPASSVTQDTEGLEKLVLSGNIRAAVNLTASVLTSLGQGPNSKSDQHGSKNTLQTLQWWNVRFTLLLRLKLLDVIKAEISLFNHFDSPDLFYSFYPDLYPGRRGSMVPFSLRLLHACLPAHAGNPSHSLGRLFKLKQVVEKIIENLHNKKTEDGCAAELKEEDKKASLQLWRKRKIHLLYCIGTTQVRLREYELAFEAYDQIIEMELRSSVSVMLHSCIGRCFLQLGDIKSAQNRFTLAERAASDSSSFKSVLVMNRGFLFLGANNWKEALNHFNEAITENPTDLEAHNNKAVCLLYLCRLKEAIATLEEAIYNNETTLFKPEKQTRQNQQSLEGACSNLVTLYELESAKFHFKRTRLLRYIATHSGDGFDISCLKL